MATFSNIRRFKFLFLNWSVVLSFLIISCNSNNSDKTNFLHSKLDSSYAKSRVTYFDYGGYGDNIYACFEGTIHQFNKGIKTKDSIIPIKDVPIKVEQTNKSVLTDSEGFFSICLPKGIYNFSVSKEGYQELKIKNFVSDPDQVSTIEIALEKGKEMQSINLPKWKKI